MIDQSPLLHAIHLAARKLSTLGRFDQVLRDVLSICVTAADASGGTIYLHDSAKHTLQFRHVLPEEVALTLELKDIPEDFGVAGQVFQTRKSIISNFDPGDEERKAVSSKVGVTSAISTMITVPLMMEGEDPIGVVQLVNKNGGPFTAQDALVLDTVSAICTMAYLNTRLLDEQTRASQLLGMGKIGHDIKNLAFALEANVSFSDDTIRGLREGLDTVEGAEGCITYVDDIEQLLTDLSTSIDRIKRYSNLMSDLSAGKRLAPTMSLGPLADTIQLAAAFMESEARKRCIQLRYDIATDAPVYWHDEMFIFRVVQNLVSNAIKAVAETTGGLDEDRPDTWKSVTVRYHFQNDHHIIEIQDEGPGMNEETAARILSGTAVSVWGKSSGSGLGTRIVLELAATHDGIVTIESQLGSGSTFRVALPHRTS
ncbi:MAG: GAF domain-containing sensor histidine kinase [Chthonomonas sp.]|nr:GAF domain-containing sensor histidine kinase [Chthonomonas sp.]